MTRFRDALVDAAEQAPPLGDIADRALAQSRRRRVRIGVPLGVAAVAASAALVAGMVAWLPAGGSSTELTNRPSEVVTVPTGTIQFPDRADPLPARNAGPVALAYSMTCDEQANANQCQWRVMTADGEHRAVPDAAHPDGAAGLSDRGLLTVSPDGERIGYFQADGTFVLRNLDSGQLREAFTWTSTDLDAWPDAVWSADGRWLVVSYDNTSGKSVLVDATTGESTKLPEPEGLSVVGIRDGEPVYQDQFPDKLFPSWDGWLGSLSPDGRTLAGLTFVKSGTQVNVADVSAPPRLVDEYPIDRDSEEWSQPVFAGWADRSNVLIHTTDTSGSDPSQYRYPANVDAFDVRTGKLDRLFHLPDSPRHVSVAAGLVGPS